MIVLRASKFAGAKGDVPKIYKLLSAPTLTHPLLLGPSSTTKYLPNLDFQRLSFIKEIDLRCCAIFFDQGCRSNKNFYEGFCTFIMRNFDSLWENNTLSRGGKSAKSSKKKDTKNGLK